LEGPEEITHPLEAPERVANLVRLEVGDRVAELPAPRLYAVPSHIRGPGHLAEPAPGRREGRVRRGYALVAVRQIPDRVDEPARVGRDRDRRGERLVHPGAEDH